MSDEAKQAEPEVLAMKVSVTTDVKIVVDPPRFYTHHRYGTAEYWKALERHLQSSIDDFEEFLRDHRSRDNLAMSTERETEDQCSLCRATWETDIDAETGDTICAYCGAIVARSAVTK